MYKNGKISIDKRLTTDRERKCVLVEELGHRFTSSGNILNPEDINNIKQEKRACNWEYEKIVGIKDIIRAHDSGVRSRYEMVEFLEITEDFLEYSIHHYKERYGVFFEIDNYIIRFKPAFGIIKRF